MLFALSSTSGVATVCQLDLVCQAQRCCFEVQHSAPYGAIQCCFAAHTVEGMLYVRACYTALFWAAVPVLDTSWN